MSSFISRKKFLESNTKENLASSQRISKASISTTAKPPPMPYDKNPDQASFKSVLDFQIDKTNR